MKLKVLLTMLLFSAANHVVAAENPSSQVSKKIEQYIAKGDSTRLATFLECHPQYEVANDLIEFASDRKEKAEARECPNCCLATSKLFISTLSLSFSIMSICLNKKSDFGLLHTATGMLSIPNIYEPITTLVEGSTRTSNAQSVLRILRQHNMNAEKSKKLN